MVARSRPIALAEHGSDRWHECRKRGIGASEAAAACGVSEYQTPYELWARKSGFLPPVEVTEAMLRGSELEPFIVRRLKEQVTLPLKDGPQILYQHPEHSWMLATPDGEFDDGGETILECKSSVSPRIIETMDSDSDDVPVEYLLQCNQQMAVTGAQRCVLAVLVPDRWKFFDLKLRVIERSEFLISEIIAAESTLWALVETRQEPQIDFNHESALRLMTQRYARPDDCGDVIDLPDESVGEWLEYERLRDEIKALEARQKAAKAKVLHAIGDNMAGTLGVGDGRMVKRRWQPPVAIEAHTREGYQVVTAVKVPKGVRK